MNRFLDKAYMISAKQVILFLLLVLAGLIVLNIVVLIITLPQARQEAEYHREYSGLFVRGTSSHGHICETQKESITHI